VSQGTKVGLAIYQNYISDSHVICYAWHIFYGLSMYVVHFGTLHCQNLSHFRCDSFKSEQL